MNDMNMKAATLLFGLFCGAAFPALADFEAGITKFDRGDFAGALRELRRPAEQGNVKAQFVVGIIQLKGLGVPPQPDAAARWIRKAAEGGLVEAQVELAQLYRDGQGVPQDLREMVGWYGRAAENGDVGAQLLVADAYAQGNGVPRDLVTAYMWYEIAMRYWGDLIESARESVAEKMSQAEIDEATRRASERPSAPGG